MGDIVDPKTRSRMMSGIRGRHTKPEMLVRSGLHGLGFRFRLHDRKLPGSPDLILKRFSAVVFVHGCFWHRHEGCRYTSTPKTRADFWRRKFAANVSRDRLAQEALNRMGWRVFIVWECALRSNPSGVIKQLADKLRAYGCDGAVID